MIVIPKLKLCYQDLPKVASTTTFSWLYECVHGTAYTREKIARIAVHYSLNVGVNAPAVRMDASEFRPENHPDYFTFALTRDPIRRFLSMYANRVIFYQELSQTSASAGRLKALGLQCSPEINVLVDNLDAYQQIDPNLHHHSRPMVDFLGRNISMYNCIADVGQFEEVVRKIHQHFELIGLPEVAKVNPPSERLQSHGPKLGLEILTPYSFEMLLEYYKDDYALLPTVSLKDTRDAYTAARNKFKERIRDRMPAALAIPTKTGTTPGTVAPAAVYPECPVATSYLDVRTLPKLGIGTVLLQKDLSPKEWSLVAKIDGTPVPVRWNIASPVMEKNNAANPNARNARFQVNDLDAMQQEFTLELHGPADQNWVVIRLSLPPKNAGTA